MSLTRTNSRTHLNETNPTIVTDIDPNPDKVVTDNRLDTTSSIASKSTIELPDLDEESKNKKPVMKLQIPAEKNSTKANEINLSPRQIPKSPRLLKSKNSTLTEEKSPRKYSDSGLPEKNRSSIEQNKTSEKNSSPGNHASISHAEIPLNSEPILQVRRTIIFAPTKLLNQKRDEANTATPASPRSTYTSSSVTSTASTSTLKTETAVSVKASPPTIEDCTRAVLYLIFKKYEDDALIPSAIRAFGRQDIHFAVKAIPKVLTHLTEFPDNGLTSVSELLIALFGDELRNSQEWKNVTSQIDKAKLLDDDSVKFGETDEEIKNKYFSLLNPHAQNIADSILGKQNNILKSALPTNFLNLLFEGDKKLLEICVTRSKLRAKEINDARLHFLFDMVVTRFAQVMAMEGFPERPSQVEAWLTSAIIEALSEGIKSLSNDFLKKSNNEMPADLKKKFFEKVEAETREIEAIKKFKLIELKKNRINELQKNERARGHSRVNSHAMLVNVKIERNYKKILDDIKSECGFDDMEADFLKFINNNQNISFDPALKTTVSNVILNLKLAVREYDEMKRSKGFQSEEKVKIVIKNLDVLFEKEFNAKQKRRTTAFSKDINFTENLNRKLIDAGAEKASTPPLISISSDTQESENTASSATTSTTVKPTQLNESSSEEKSDE